MPQATYQPTSHSAASDPAGVLQPGKYMTFKLAQQEYGLAILSVREIIGLMEITRVPKTQPFIRGVINLRGRVIPVIDLRLKFGMDPIEATEQTVIIVVQCEHLGSELTMGVLVDEVLEVVNISADELSPTPSLGGGSDMQFILGIGQIEQRIVFLLDIVAVLTVRDERELTAAGINEETSAAQLTGGGSASAQRRP